MPAVSEAQRRLLYAKFGAAWVKRHHFDNKGHLPAHVTSHDPPKMAGMTNFTAAQRMTLAKRKEAMPGGRYPIRNRSDLHNAIMAVGRSKTPGATRAWIRKRAAALGATDMIPPSWS